MLNYADWLGRAVRFTKGLADLPGTVRLEVNVTPPVSALEFSEIASGCRLPIPEPLRRFWMEASASCHCAYSWWDLPSEFLDVLKRVFSGNSSLSGGPNLGAARDSVELVESFLDWANGFRGDYPKDARFWEYSIPFIPVGNGDHVALYVRDNLENPPVAYLCHDGCGASDIIAPDFDTFLRVWEQFGYICMDFLLLLRNPRTGFIDADAFAIEAAAIQALLRGEVVREDSLASSGPDFAEADWLTTADPERMLKWLEQAKQVDERKLRLVACACCQRVASRMGEVGRQAVDIAERFADGHASQAELEIAKMAMLGGAKTWQHSILPFDCQSGAELAKQILADPNAIFREPFRSISERFMTALRDGVAFTKNQGVMHYAANCAVDLRWGTFVSWHICQHLDEPDLSREKAAHADLVRHIFGNPFRSVPQPRVTQLEIVRLAKRLYDGEDCAAELRKALDQEGEGDLAEHFRVAEHPKGCWALDLLLGK